MAVICRKVFVGPKLYLGFKGLNHYRDWIRDMAEAFINDEIGLDRVVLVSEHVTGNGPFSVAVWFRADGPTAAPSDSLEASNAMLRDQPRGSDVRPGANG